MELLSSLKTKLDLTTANEFQRRIIQAISNDTTFTPIATLTSLSLATFNWTYYQQMTALLLPRVAPPSASHWRATYKALVLLEQMMLVGNDEIVLELRHRMDALHALEVTRIEDGGEEVGGGIREIAKRVRGWVLDVDAWREAREEAKKRREGHARYGADDWKAERRSSWQGGDDGWAGPGGEGLRKQASFTYGAQQLDHYDVNAMRREEQEKQRRRSSSSTHGAAADAAALQHAQQFTGRSPSHPPLHPHHPPTPHSVMPIPALVSGSTSPSTSPSADKNLALTNPKLAAAIQASGFRPRASSLHSIGAVPSGPGSTYHTPQVQTGRSTTDLSFLLDESDRRVTLSPPPNSLPSSSSFPSQPPQPQQPAQPPPARPQQEPPEFVPEYLKRVLH